MAHGEVKHDYHLVEPSPWPLVGSTAVFIFAVGLVIHMRADEGGIWGINTPWVLIIGALGIVYTMIGWWRDVIKEAEVERVHTPVVLLGLRYGMILFIASEVMFFVGWFWAYFGVALYPGTDTLSATGDLLGQVQRQELVGGHWPPEGIATFDPWHLPLLNTLILLTSGTTVTWAHHALQSGNRASAKLGLWLTILLGITFTFVQYLEYSHAGFGFSGHIYGATFFMATGFHGFHVIVGTIFLSVVLLQLYRGHFSPERHFGFEAAAWYWHFVDVVWLFLFVSIYVGSAGGTGAAGGH